MADSAVDVVLAIDISSSGVRARAHDRSFRTLADSAVELETRVDAEGASAHDFNAIRAAVVSTVRAVAQTPGLTVRGIGASGTASSLGFGRRGPTRAPTGVSEVVLWSDTRALPHFDDVRSALVGAFDRTLCPPDPSYWPAKLRWLTSAGMLGPADSIAGGKDLVFEWLTGRFWTDPMSAAATGVFDSAAWRWDPELLELVGVTLDQLPEVREATDTAPLTVDAARELGLPPGTLVAAGGMDGPLTQLGAGGVSSGVASCTIGTSIAFRGGADGRLVDPTRRVWCYPVTRSWWVAGGAGSNGGNVLTWLRDRIGLDESVGAIAALAFEVPADPALTFVPYLNGERAPLWRPEVRAAFIGLAAHHSSADLSRAALDGIAAAVVELADAVESLIGVPERVVLTGGFLREERWVQLMTDALGVATCVPKPDTATSNGIAAIAWAGVEDAPLETVFAPRWQEVASPDPAAKAALVDVSRRVVHYRELLWPEG